MRSLVVLFAVLSVAVSAPGVVKRSIGHVAYTVPTAVSHQSRVDVRTSPAVVDVAPAVASHFVAAPEAHAVVAPYTAVYGAGAVSHQSRVDVRTSPVVVSAAQVVAPALVTEPVLEARSVYAASVPSLYIGGASVSHQSRYDVHSSPSVVTEEVAAPTIVEARSLLPVNAW
ncbi:cuticular protein hypothetical 6 precursor [Bombyx mori]|uniref:Putative cuticle protein n=1 Tax=Bombyx mori TaxID=7091 RepID=C0H6G2_BOMMO|nr:cuticular protein hypothetical 6 precursor [Bombyx mori]FAA00473.1 TPA: putative cuticle protein [Bombyx mori]